MLVGGACLERCVFHAIAEENAIFLVREEHSMGCRICYPACPVDAIFLVEARPAYFIPEYMTISHPCDHHRSKITHFPLPIFIIVHTGKGPWFRRGLTFFHN